MLNNESIIKAITVDESIAKISILEVPDVPGIAFKLFSRISSENIKIESIVQNVNRNSVNDITFTVSKEEAVLAKEITEDFASIVGASGVSYDDTVARLSVIGAAIVANSHIASKFFKALFDLGVNIQMISTSEDKISCVIDKSKAQESLKQIYKEFEVN
ncbi:MAG: ACT domain-containing protein [Eubacteriaceae bacterium]|jgi:aspartate kinase|nr:ACT domain-containing protein [Eubacteriaceae bacterium]